MHEGHGGRGGQGERGAGPGIGRGDGAHQQTGGDAQPGPAHDARRADPKQGSEGEEPGRHHERAEAEVEERVVRRGARQVVGPHGPDIQVQQHDADHADGLGRAGQSAPGQDARRRERGEGDGRRDGRAHDEPVGDERVDHVEDGGDREQHHADGEQHGGDADPAPRRRGCRRRGRGRVDADRRLPLGGGPRRLRLDRHRRLDRRRPFERCRRLDRRRQVDVRAGIRCPRDDGRVLLGGGRGPHPHRREQPLAFRDRLHHAPGRVEDVSRVGSADVEPAAPADERVEDGEAGRAQVGAEEVVRPPGPGLRADP
ncbi:hypothetical protein BFL35_06055 [Clavibacter michiganensis]|nr:hypothetical protein BFL35_06055 [Clavibacter michiganensis]